MPSVFANGIRRLHQGLFALTLVALSSPTPAEPLPISYFTRDGDIASLQISPEGDFLAVTQSIDGISSLMFFELDGMNLVGGVRAGRDDLITQVNWISNSRAVYSYAERFRGRDFPVETGELFAIDRDGRASRQLYGFRAGDARTGTRLSRRDSTDAIGELLSPLRTDDDAILIIERPYESTRGMLHFNADAHPRVVRLNVYTGRKKRLDIVLLALADVVVDRDEQVRFAMGYDEDASYVAIWKPEPGAEWAKFELPGFRDDSVIVHRFTEDELGVLFSAVAEGETTSGLYRLDLHSASITGLYRHEEADIDGTVTDFTGDSVIGVTVYSDKLEYHWIADEHPGAKLHQMLQQAFAGKSFRVTSVDRYGRRGIIFVYSDVSPGDYYLFDTQTMNATYLQAAEQWVDPQLMRPKEPIAMHARDGLLLRGYLTRPHDHETSSPLIVLPHGGPHGARDRWGYDREVQLLANRGYAVLQINFRGSAGYGADFQAAGYNEWGASMQDDLTDATLWAIDQGITETGRVCIFGTSYGGYAALMGAVRAPRLYRCAIAHAGVYDLELMFEKGDTQRWRIGQAMLDRFLGNDVELLRERSPVHHAERIEVPVLLIHGKDDTRADYEHAVRMKKALEKAGKQFEWLALSREGHGVFDQETRQEVYERILVFLGRHLPLNDIEQSTTFSD